MVGKKDLKRKTLAVGITLLFIVSVISPLVFGNNNELKQLKQVSNLDDPPGIEWFQSYGGSESDFAWSVKQTNDGGYIFTGDTQSYGEYGTTDAWLCKTDAYGNVLWNYAFGEPGFENMDVSWDVVLVSDGGYAFSGKTASYNVEGDFEIWLVKTDENGIEEWNKTYGRGSGYSLHQTQDGGYIIGGDRGYGRGSLLRTDSNGNEIWRNTFWGSPGNSALGLSVDATSDGGFVLTGRLYYADDDIESDIFLIKTDADGVEVVNTTFGGPLNQARGESIQQTSDGGFALSGFIKDEDENLINAWLIKTDAFGNEEWNQTFNEPINYRDYLANDCKQTQDGGYVLVGTKEPHSGLMDSFIIKTDSNGEKEWELTLEGPETSDEHIQSVDLTQDGGFIAVGLEGWYADAFLIKIGHKVDISMNKPEDALYLFDSKIRNFQNRNPLIIGPITVEVDASDDEYDIDRVEFYIDGQLMETDTSEPYSWRWNKLSFFTHSLKAVAYNSNGNVGIEEKSVWKFL